MKFIFKLADWVNYKVNNFGPQYFTFAILNLINHPVAIIYDLKKKDDIIILILRIIACILNIIILYQNKFPKKAKRFIALYWYFTLILSVPTITTTLLICNKFTLEYLINFNIGVMIILLVVDWFSFVFIQILGILLGIALTWHNYNIYQAPDEGQLKLFFYMFICIVVLNSILTRNREIYSNLLRENNKKHKQLLERKIKKRTLELQQSLVVKTEFLNNMSHEIRTPVQGFTVISEGLADKWYEFDEAKRFSLVKTIASNAKRLSSLLGGILDLAKFNEGKIHLHLSNFNLNTLIQDIIDEAKILYVHDKPIEFIFKPNQDILISADYERVGQLFRNIIVNAIRYQEKGQITINIQKQAKLLNISISDEGIGIPKTELKSIFTPFTQSTRTKTKAGGTGLGLAIVSEIVRAHSGKIWAQNNKTQGATFHIERWYQKIGQVVKDKNCYT